jgi:hypothetical protein
MAKIFTDYVHSRIIIKELIQYRAYDKAFRDGMSKNERPHHLQRMELKTSKLLLGKIVHSTNYILQSLSKVFGMVKAQEWLAGNRIRTDEYSSEPMSYGIHYAYTEYGLARLAQGDVALAIQSLSYSTKIHPCPRLISHGFLYALRNKLASYAEAKEAIQLFDEAAYSFNRCKWH